MDRWRGGAAVSEITFNGISFGGIGGVPAGAWMLLLRVLLLFFETVESAENASIGNRYRCGISMVRHEILSLSGR